MYKSPWKWIEVRRNGSQFVEMGRCSQKWIEIRKNGQQFVEMYMISQACFKFYN